MSTADDDTVGVQDSARENVKVSLAKKYDIPIERLSYEHIGGCNNAREMEQIVKILRSGEEGTYPHLIDFAENKLRELNPKCKVLRKLEPALVPGSLDRDEWAGVRNDLVNWSEEVKAVDMNLGNLPIKSLDIYTEEEPIRTVKKEVKKIASATKPKIEVIGKPIKSIVPRSYADWDKFDADEELLRLDTSEERNKEEREVKNKLGEEKDKEATKKLKEKLNKQKERYNKAKVNGKAGMLEKEAVPAKVTYRSSAEEAFVKKMMANQERVKGNEFFKQGDFRMAAKYFSDSIELQPSVNAYNNLALALYKLGSFEDAIEACNGALSLEPDNVKALYRRGTSHLRLQLHKLAAQDLQRVTELESKNKLAAKLLACALEWDLATKDTPPRRMQITEIDQMLEEESGSGKSAVRDSQVKSEQDYLKCITDKSAGFTEEDFTQLLTEPKRQKDAASVKSNRPKIIELSSVDFTEETDNRVASAELAAKPTRTKIVQLNSTNFDKESDNSMVNGNLFSKENNPMIIELSNMNFQDELLKKTAEGGSVNVGNGVDGVGIKASKQAADEVIDGLKGAEIDGAGSSDDDCHKDFVGKAKVKENNCNGVFEVIELSFASKWKQIENDPDMSKHAAFLLQFEPEDLPKLLKNDLDLVVHAGLMLCLEKQASVFSNRVIEYVCGIVECSQFRDNRQRLSKDIDDIFVRLVESIVVQQRGIPMDEFEAGQQASGEATNWRLPADFCNWEANEQLKLTTWGCHPTIASVLSQALINGDSDTAAEN